MLSTTVHRCTVLRSDPAESSVLASCMPLVAAPMNTQDPIGKCSLTGRRSYSLLRPETWDLSAEARSPIPVDRWEIAGAVARTCSCIAGDVGETMNPLQISFHEPLCQSLQSISGFLICCRRTLGKDYTPGFGNNVFVVRPCAGSTADFAARLSLSPYTMQAVFWAKC